MWQMATRLDTTAFKEKNREIKIELSNDPNLQKKYFLDQIKYLT
jgi:hypothetical protein